MQVGVLGGKKCFLLQKKQKFSMGQEFGPTLLGSSAAYG